ncbi:B3 DNA binding domain containing protein [Trema orientale]|uniref:B3 DNA binding domain containing protein n=1 Tax=Trema orientale TaxID=63057 RepID=A0A2P5DI43_TREOI|nr:B3 DNA binding domain containing protein [Trema orientale]
MEEQMSNEGSNVSSTSNNEEELLDEEFWPLSGKPFFTVILAKSHVHPINRLVLPAKILPLLPSLVVPVVLTNRGKKWDMFYDGTNDNNKRFDSSWRTFANENNLKIGDACVFELEESSTRILVFRVQILRGDIPSELLPRIIGESSASPIVIK